MARTETVRIGTSVRLDFTGLLSDGTTVVLPAGTKGWVSVKANPSSEADPPIVELRNSAAGGSDSQAAVVDAGSNDPLQVARTSGYLTPSDTALLSHGRNYVFGCTVQLPTGEVYELAEGVFSAAFPVLRTPN